MSAKFINTALMEILVAICELLLTSRQTDGRTDGQTDRQTDRHTDGQTEIQADGQTQVDGWTGRQTVIIKVNRAL